MLPNDYPTNPGDFMMLTPNGRFQINSKICLTNSGYHKESWTPIWNIRNMLKGFISIFNSDVEHGISHIKDSLEQRKNYAHNSIEYNLLNYYEIFRSFDQFVNMNGTIKAEDEQNTEKHPSKKEKKHNIIIEIPQINADGLTEDITGAIVDDTVENITEDVMEEDVMEEDVMEEDVMEEDVMEEDVMEEDVMEDNVVEDVIVVITDRTTECTKRCDLIKSYLETIKKMSFENFNEKLYLDVYNLLTTSLSEM
jgi:pentapeptide MXKDX repeat protein